MAVGWESAPRSQVGLKTIAHTTDSSSRLLPYRVAARRCSAGHRGLPSAPSAASWRNSALVTRISVAPRGQGEEDRRQAPRDPEVAQGEVHFRDQDEAGEQDDRGGGGDDRAAVQVALVQQRRLRGPVVASAEPHLQDVDRQDAPEPDDGGELVQEMEQVLDRAHVPASLEEEAGGNWLHPRCSRGDGCRRQELRSR